MSPQDTARTIARDCVGYRVRMLNRTISRIYDDALRPHGLRFSQMNILTTVLLRSPTQAADVGRVLALEKSTLSRNLRLMEANGWLSGEDLPSGVGRRLRVTPQGEELYQAAAPAWRQAQETIEALLEEPGTSAIRHAADRVARSRALS